MKKQYYDIPKLVNSEIDLSGFKRVWFQIADEEIIMLKFTSDTSADTINETVLQQIQVLKDRQNMLEQLEILEQQVLEIKQQLGLQL